MMFSQGPTGNTRELSPTLLHLTAGGGEPVALIFWDNSHTDNLRMSYKKHNVSNLSIDIYVLYMFNGYFTDLQQGAKFVLNIDSLKHNSGIK